MTIYKCRGAHDNCGVRWIEQSDGSLRRERAEGPKCFGESYLTEEEKDLLVTHEILEPVS